MIYNSDYLLEDIKNKIPLIFLAGSIDLELNSNWRSIVAEKLKSQYNFLDPTNLNHANLTSKEWENHIKWELKAMERSDIILMNFIEEA